MCVSCDQLANGADIKIGKQVFTYKYVVKITQLFVHFPLQMGQLRNQALIDLIAGRVKQIREAKGITQEIVVFDTSINIGRIEAGQVNISVSTLEAVCSYFNITLKEFFAEGFE